MIIEYDLLPFVPLIGDGDGERGLFAMRIVDTSPSEFKSSFRFMFDENTYNYTLDDGSLSSSHMFSPSDLSVVDQYNNNLTSASESEMLMRSVRESKQKRKMDDQDVFKKHSSIGELPFSPLQNVKLCEFSRGLGIWSDRVLQKVVSKCV